MTDKILIVDDVEENRRLLHDILKQQPENYTLLTACNGKEAIEIAQKELPSLILMDWKMPEMNGIEATKKIKQNSSTKDIPVLIITAFSSTDNLQEAYSAGANDYISKPIKSKELLSRVKVFLQYHGAIHQLQRQNHRIEKQVEDLRKLSMVIQKSQNSFILLNLKNEIEWVNAGFEKIHGYTIEEYKKHFGKTLSDENYSPGIEKLIRICCIAGESADIIRKSYTKENDCIWMKVTINPIYDKKNELERVVLIETDITHQKETEAKLNKHNEHMKGLTEHLEEANALLEQKNKEIEEQQAILLEEQLKSENLLNSLFPKEVAWQLKSKGKAKPRHYKSVSIMFSDFKGFSRTSDNLSPQELLNILDSYFSKFDEIADKHFIEKIKTIGDAYMCAGGLPLRNKSHPFDVVLAALEIQHFMNKLNDEKVLNNLSTWECRIGIHTGDVVAGVIGKNKFAYDIWGSNVNIASRMEQNGHVGMVNISGSTYEKIKDYFDCDYRGKIEAKNIGKIDMYFVYGLKEEYCHKRQPHVPNETFRTILAQF